MGPGMNDSTYIQESPVCNRQVCLTPNFFIITTGRKEYIFFKQKTPRITAGHDCYPKTVTVSKLVAETACNIVFILWFVFKSTFGYSQIFNSWKRSTESQQNTSSSTTKQVAMPQIRFTICNKRPKATTVSKHLISKMSRAFPKS